MVSFGRRSNRQVAMPNNRGMADRANRQLEGLAVSKAEQFETSLGVDAPSFYFWHNGDGSIPCSCVAARRGPNRDIDVGGLTKFNYNDETSTNKPAFDLIETEYGNASIDELFGKPTGKTKRPTVTDRLADDYDDPNETYDSDDDDIKEIDVEFETTGTTDFSDPLNLFADKIIDCSVCFGSGYIDAWNVHGGRRFVFETSDAYDFHCQGITIDDSKSPYLMVTEKNANAFWQFKLPKVWDRILRINVYNGIKIIPAYEYRWVMQDEDSVITTITEKNLNELNGTGQNLKLSLSFVNEGIEFTHAEIIFAFSSARKAQIPEITQGYEQEFLDWNVNLSVELPPDLQISEGDYLTESKYRKVWKVSTLTKKVTVGGTVYGLSADLRALHSFEKDFVQLALFTTNFLTGNLVKR